MTPVVAIHLSLAAGDGRQEWERCYHLAKCRSLAQDHSGRVELPALGRDNSSSVQEAREVTRFVVEDLNDNLFVELVGYMHEASAPKPKPWGHKSPVVKAFRRAWRYVQQKVHQGVQWVRGRMQRVNWQRLWRRPAFRLIICSVTGTITWIIMIHVLPITAILWVGRDGVRLVSPVRSIILDRPPEDSSISPSRGKGPYQAPEAWKETRTARYPHQKFMVCGHPSPQPSEISALAPIRRYTRFSATILLQPFEI